MRPYLDAGYLLTLLVKTTGSVIVIANESIGRLDGPILLNALHQFQTVLFFSSCKSHHVLPIGSKAQEPTGFGRTI